MDSSWRVRRVSLRRIETRLTRQLESIEAKKEELKGLRARIHSKEVDLRAQEEVIAKFNQQIRKIRTNKEYTTLQHEISIKKVDASRIEDDILALMADIEDLEKEIKELEQSVAQIQKELAEEERLVKQEAAKLIKRRAELQSKRRGVSEGVDAELLEEYERIAASKGSSAVALCVGHTCQGCFMQIPPQLDHNLRAGTKIVHCPSCSRILYLP
ncbi:zinc ribbon domain-containing protein [Planctomycetota bacterium]